VDEERHQADTVERCEASAQHALQAYRERRRRRRAADTYFGSAEVLVPRGAHAPAERELERRRSEILEDAEAEGMPRELSGLLYDVALEEGLDPSLAYELVRTGLGVAPPPEGLSNAAQEPASDPYLPPWMFPPEPTDQLLRERMLHTSFRRLRSLLEREENVDEAFRLFANEPDVGHHGY